MKLKNIQKKKKPSNSRITDQANIKVSNFSWGFELTEKSLKMKSSITS